MEAKEYCDSMTAELSAWKTKMEDAVNKFDRASSGDKKRIMKEVNEMHVIADGLGRRINELRRDCPSGFTHKR